MGPVHFWIPRGPKCLCDAIETKNLKKEEITECTNVSKSQDGKLPRNEATMAA